MTKEEKKDGYLKAHTVEVTINDVPHRVSILYLDNLKKSLGKAVKIDKAEQSKADEYLAAKPDPKTGVSRKEEAAKVTAKK